MDAQAETKLRAAHEALLQTRGLQFEFATAPKPPAPPGWLEPLLRGLAAAAPVLKVVFWIGLAVAAALILWMIVRDLPIAGRWRRRGKASAPSDWRPDAAEARALLAEADRLAAARAYGEAIHLILFRSIEDIAARRPGAVRPALTSRDIVATAPLSEVGRRAFSLIAETVELSFFGGRPAAREDFDRCRREYEAFALAEAAA
jgi:hypothetical protein